MVISMPLFQPSWFGTRGMDEQTSTTENRFDDPTYNCYLKHHLDVVTRARRMRNLSCTDWVLIKDNMLLYDISSSQLAKCHQVIVELDLGETRQYGRRIRK